MPRLTKRAGAFRGARRAGGKRWAVISAPVLALTLAFTLWTPAANAALLPVGGLTQGLEGWMLHPATTSGANDYTCKPTAAHPRPVILVHGTSSNTGMTGPMLSPTLKNAGYCVFSINYGGVTGSLGRALALGDIPASAGQLKAFVDNVLAKTGASKVDLVGHSQGGMMPNYYIKRLGGAAKVGTLVGIAPSNHGTTLSGITNIGASLRLLGIANTFLMATGPALAQQEVGSPFMKALFADGDTVPGVKYVVIETRNDKVVTPYTNAFLSGPNVKNILIQDQCPTDNTGHISIIFDSPTVQNVLNELGPNTPGFKATCVNMGHSI